MAGSCSISSASYASFKDGFDSVPNSLRRKEGLNSVARIPIYWENKEEKKQRPEVSCQRRFMVKKYLEW